MPEAKAMLLLIVLAIGSMGVNSAVGSPQSPSFMKSVVVVCKESAHKMLLNTSNHKASAMKFLLFCKSTTPSPKSMFAFVV